LPPPDTAVRHRRGYRQLDPEDDTNQPDGVPEGLAIENEEDGDNAVERDTEREAVQHDGWYSLTWSFVASGFLTVSLPQIEAS
jgi:hypothetical protein